MKETNRNSIPIYLFVRKVQRYNDNRDEVHAFPNIGQLGCLQYLRKRLLWHTFCAPSCRDSRHISALLSQVYLPVWLLYCHLFLITISSSIIFYLFLLRVCTTLSHMQLILHCHLTCLFIHARCFPHCYTQADMHNLHSYLGLLYFTSVYSQVVIIVVGSLIFCIQTRLQAYTQNNQSTQYTALVLY